MPITESNDEDIKTLETYVNSKYSYYSSLYSIKNEKARNWWMAKIKKEDVKIEKLRVEIEVTIKEEYNMNNPSFIEYQISDLFNNNQRIKIQEYKDINYE